jgi:hypothetical protein
MLDDLVYFKFYSKAGTDSLRYKYEVELEGVSLCHWRTLSKTIEKTYNIW